MTDNETHLDQMRQTVAKNIREAVRTFNTAMKNADALGLKVVVGFAKEHEPEDAYGGLVIRKIWWTETKTVDYTA